MAIQIVFEKTGREIKTAIQNRRQQLEQRLAARNAALDEFMQNSQKVRSYLIRHSDAVAMMYRGGAWWAWLCPLLER